MANIEAAVTNIEPAVPKGEDSGGRQSGGSKGASVKANTSAWVICGVSWRSREGR